MWTIFWIIVAVLVLESIFEDLIGWTVWLMLGLGLATLMDRFFN